MPKCHWNLALVYQVAGVGGPPGNGGVSELDDLLKAYFTSLGFTTVGFNSPCESHADKINLCIAPDVAYRAMRFSVYNSA